jgi:hypothetical protein
MLNIKFRVGTVVAGAGAASCCYSGSSELMRLMAASAPQHRILTVGSYGKNNDKKLLKKKKTNVPSLDKCWHLTTDCSEENKKYDGQIC